MKRLKLGLNFVRFLSFIAMLFLVFVMSAVNEPSVLAKTANPVSNAPNLNYATQVQPILFIPNNLMADPQYLPAIDATMLELSHWYASELGGKTFHHSPAVAVTGQYQLSHYCPKTISETQCIQVPGEIGADAGDVYNVFADLNQQGYPLQSKQIIVLFWVGGYGYAGGVKLSDNSGWAAHGDWALDGIAGKYEDGTASSNCDDSSNAWLICTQNAQIGTVGHEMGHAFGLPHPTDDGSQPGDPNYWLATIMAVHWDYPNVMFIDSPTNPEKSTLLNHPFFQYFDIFLPLVRR